MSSPHAPTPLGPPAPPSTRVIAAGLFAVLGLLIVLFGSTLWMAGIAWEAFHDSTRGAYSAAIMAARLTPEFLVPLALSALILGGRRSIESARALWATALVVLVLALLRSATLAWDIIQYLKATGFPDFLDHYWLTQFSLAWFSIALLAAAAVVILRTTRHQDQNENQLQSQHEREQVQVHQDQFQRERGHEHLHEHGHEHELTRAGSKRSGALARSLAGCAVLFPALSLVVFTWGMLTMWEATVGEIFRQKFDLLELARYALTLVAVFLAFVGVWAVTTARAPRPSRASRASKRPTAAHGLSDSLEPTHPLEPRHPLDPNQAEPTAQTIASEPVVIPTDFGLSEPHRESVGTNAIVQQPTRVWNLSAAGPWVAAAGIALIVRGIIVGFSFARLFREPEAFAVPLKFVITSFDFQTIGTGLVLVGLGLYLRLWRPQ